MRAKYILLSLCITLIPQYGHNKIIESLTKDTDGCRMEYSDGGNPCMGHIRCTSQINNFGSIMNSWECIRRYSGYSYNYGYNRQSRDYNLHTFFVNIEDDTAWNTLETYKSHIQLFSLTGGNLYSVPSVIDYMENIREFELVYNEIEEFKVNSFLNKPMMTKMNLSHNAITTVDAEYGVLSGKQAASLTTLDLSYNLIEVLPNKCFENFGNVNILDLSHNNIKTLDIFTFEGLAFLQTLKLSCNKLTTIGHSFVRFVTLKYLDIDHNRIKTLLESNLISMVKLEKLNMSYNEIENIESVAFRSLSSLQGLDVSHNRISVIKESLFINITNLNTLLLSDNEIEIIEPRAFEGTNITDFSIENNRLSGIITRDTFVGVKVANLVLSGGKIQSLGDNAFSILSENLMALNLSLNSLTNISSSAFKSLTMLSTMDLSYNNISELNFDTSDLKNLSLFYAQNNRITKIHKSVFCHLSSLVELDLSHNMITDIDLNTFDALSKLKKLLLNDNDLANAIDAYVFRTLIAIDRIDFTNTKIVTYNNETFTNMTSLTTFTSSNGQLTNIAYNAFLGTGSITKFDFSYNLLDDFSVNTTTINGVITIYLNNNRLTNVTHSTFYGLKFLQILDLSFNNILSVEWNSFQSLTSLVRLDLSSNSDMVLASNTFDNLTWLEDIYLSNIRKPFTFINATNTTMSKLLLSKHNIGNINDIFVFHVKKLAKLDLSLNKITYVDRYSFQVMKSLTWLDLSGNLITDIQPGSFSHLHIINELNLHDNEIQSMQYGVLDGLNNLRKLNLSSNALHNFEANILHTTPLLEVISLDNNFIKSLKFSPYTKTSLKSIYLGGNPILCSTLVDLKNNKFLYNFNVTAEKLDYSSENVHGVTCKTSVKDVLNEVYNNSGGNLTIMFKELAKTVVDLQETLKGVANNTATKEDILNNALTDVAKSVKVLAASYNKSQIASEKNVNMFLRVLNESDHKSHSNNTISTNIGNESSMMLKGYLKDIFVNKQQDGKEDKADYKDIRFLLYVITVCLVLTMISVSGFVLYIFVVKKSQMRLISSQCTQPIIGNSIEMD